MISAYLPYWPQFTLGGNAFSFVPVPVVIGFSQVARSMYPDVLFPKMGRAVAWTGGVVIVGWNLCVLAADFRVGGIINRRSVPGMHLHPSFDCVSGKVDLSLHRVQRGLSLLGFYPIRRERKWDLCQANAFVLSMGLK